MKKMRKLIPAFCMLLLSAVMLSTSTFAWFSMNTTVTATGMKITAKADSKFLQIVPSGTEFSDTIAQTSATAANPTNQVRPTSPAKTVGTDNLTPLDNETAASAIKWAEAFSADPTSSTKNGNYNDVTSLATSTEGNIYTLINDFQVRLNPKTGGATATNLTVSSVTITSTASKDQLKPAVRVLFVCGDNWVIWDADGRVNSKDGTSSVLAETVTTSATDIKVYIYFDGEDEATTTNNATAIGSDGYNVVFNLTVS